MYLQLHLIEYYFFEKENHFQVMCVAFEDGSYSVYVFRMNFQESGKKCIGSFDVEREPTSAEAKDFLIKSLS